MDYPDASKLQQMRHPWTSRRRPRCRARVLARHPSRYPLASGKCLRSKDNCPPINIESLFGGRAFQQIEALEHPLESRGHVECSHRQNWDGWVRHQRSRSLPGLQPQPHFEPWSEKPIDQEYGDLMGKRGATRLGDRDSF